MCAYFVLLSQTFFSRDVQAGSTALNGCLPVSSDPTHTRQDACSVHRGEGAVSVHISGGAEQEG